MPRPCGHGSAFIAGTVIPFEQEAVADGVTDDLRVKLQGLTRATGVFALQAPLDFGGGGADFRTTALLLEEAGYSLLGPLAMNCAAPDEGNMHLLSVVASPEQKERYLRPLVAGAIRSCFAMTEPPPGGPRSPAGHWRECATRSDWLGLSPVSLAVVSRHIPTSGTIDQNGDVAISASLVDVARSLEPLIREHAQALDDNHTNYVETAYTAIGSYFLTRDREAGPQIAGRPFL